MERDENVVDMGKQILDFNSHAHVERDFFAMIENRIRFISTHTLTWSVTDKSYLYFLTRVISTHTLTWSVTPTIKNDYHGSMDFNSHAHVERDT